MLHLSGSLRTRPIDCSLQLLEAGRTVSSEDEADAGGLPCEPAPC